MDGDSQFLPWVLANTPSIKIPGKERSPMPRLLSTAGLGRISARKPWLVVGLWVVLLVLAGIA